MAYIISCIGHEQAGKDTAFRWIKELYSPQIEVLRYAHADALKDIAAKILNLPREDFDIKMKTSEGAHLRNQLVRISAALKDSLGADIFAQAFNRFVQTHPNALIVKTDDRFTEELAGNPDHVVYLAITHPFNQGDPRKVYYAVVEQTTRDITQGILPGQVFHNSEISTTPTPAFQQTLVELVRPFGLHSPNPTQPAPDKLKTSFSHRL